MKRFFALLLAVIACAQPAAAGQSDAGLRAALQRDLDRYLSARSKIEHISAISLSISLHGRPQNINVTAGTTKYGGAGGAVTPAHLWQIGSNTKSFTAAAILQLEAEGVLTIDQTVGRWLPQYSVWKSVTIRRLLNMTSGIPAYDFVPQMLADYARNPKRDFTAAELIAYVYPGKPGAPKPTTGFDYSNTNYLIAELIIERATHNTYASEIERRFLHSDVGLTSTYYSGTQYPVDVLDRMVSGYFFSHAADNYGMAPLVGRDVSRYSVSWMRAAGSIVSTPEDLTRWARALYTGPMLAAKQRAELLTIVSMTGGKPIKTTDLRDPHGFGLGVAQITTPQTGTIWFYKGMTFGYRMLHLYLPRQDAVIAFGLNSQADPKRDDSLNLALTIYQTLHAEGRI
ncbi:MAG: serine hydrolase [Candidatus Eremiobacteraeota bacterium]|nr:serine hydrolase [Candidatus Eremiobacteraeota bacterium]